MPELLTKKNERTLVDSKDYERYSGITWFLDSKGYFHSRIGRLHVLILGKRKNRVIDHVNQNKLDNRRINLQFLTNAQNVLKQKRHKRNISGVAGVSFVKENRKWRARMQVNGKNRILHYGSFVECCKARKEAELKFWKR